MELRIGAVADDFTGATDLASMLTRGGLKTVLQLGVPEPDDECPQAEAIVVALKSRTAPVDDAVADSVASWRWMAGGGARQCYFKYCSTFDSTPAGNIGPVSMALMAATEATQTVYTPALPENGRTIYQGKLFVGGILLSESGMRNHPLTPMTDADLTRILAAQLPHGAKVGLVPWEAVHRGREAIAEQLLELAAEGISHIVVDGICQDYIDALAAAVFDMPLVTGGSGLGLSLARQLAQDGKEAVDGLPVIGGATLMLSGSCSEATNRQVARWISDGGAALHLDPRHIADGTTSVETLFGDLRSYLETAPVLVTATQLPETVQEIQSELGAERAAGLVEETLSQLAAAARNTGVRRFIVAGGETSGAVTSALGAQRMALGPSIAPGVPWCATLDAEPIALALKSGNFGAETFFRDALETAP